MDHARGSDPLELENWIEPLAAVTFETQFVELTVQESQALVDSYQQKKSDNQEALKGLTDRLNRAMAGNPAFVRLSTRSPKDYALRADRTRRIFLAERDAIVASGACAGESQDTIDVICIIRSMSRALRVENGQEAVDMLSHSERSYQDLTRRLLNWEPMNVVVRRWATNLLPELELRAFVFRKKLTAVSQYYKACYAPLLVLSRDKIAAACHRLFQYIKDRIPTDSYILDMAYQPESDSCILVELNHWHHTTSSAMFDWKRDIELLENGPFTLRIQPGPIENVRSLIARPLRAMAGWEEVAPSSSKRDMHADGEIPLPAYYVGKSKLGSTWKIKRAVRDFNCAHLDSTTFDRMRADLATVAKRRVPAPFWTYADVTLIAPGRFLRPQNEEAPLTFENNKIPTLYVVLFLALIGCGKEQHKLLKGYWELGCSACVQAFGDTLDIEMQNTLLALKQLGLVERNK